MGSSLGLQRIDRHMTVSSGLYRATAVASFAACASAEVQRNPNLASTRRAARSRAIRLRVWKSSTRYF
ncbi:hypothetical protein RGAI101_1649 [Roseobacter sp. GAI101]|nr:hypothetical protein RGAI101_1649 [Roseobacter sp. GAI101]